MKKQNIAILTFPISNAGNIPLSNLIDVLYPLSSNLHVITGNDGYTFLKNDKRIHIHGVTHDLGKSTFSRIMKYVSTQIKISCKLLKIRDIDTWIFFIGGDTLLLPMLAAKLMRKNVILSSVSSTLQHANIENSKFSNIIEILEHINRSISNCIILHSSNLVNEWNLERYKTKICIAHEYFLDFRIFKIKKKFSDRKNLIGYAGRLSEEKGVLNFIRAIKEIIEERDDIEFLIIGDGQLRNKIKKYLDENNLNRVVKLVGWVDHNELPNYLNELKLLIIPSYTESGPIIALEAMACGVPIVSTRVGHILNMVKNGETGFIMKNNSPICITRNVVKALECPNLYMVADNARKFVEKEFTYEIAIEKYRKILECM